MPAPLDPAEKEVNLNWEARIFEKLQICLDKDINVLA